MQRKVTLSHGNISVQIFDDALDVVSEPPAEAKNITGFAKVWVVADVYVFQKGKDHKKVANQSDTFQNEGITFEVPIPAFVLQDNWVKENSKAKLSLVYYDKNKKKWIKFKDQVIDLEKNKATVTLKKWIKDPPMGWGGDTSR
ncbi:MAG TPA: hypothetical protein DCY42_01330 [Chloroflexi bacterium]|nr:hypothetical protein [Chloroflexota bacterium]